MGWFDKLFKNGPKDAIPEGAFNFDREVISLLKGRDKPFLVDHTAITHAFMLIPKSCVPDPEQDNKSLIDELLCTVNPELWPRVLRTNSNIPTLWLVNNKAGNGPEFILNALDEFGALNQSSVYMGTPTISFDGSRTPVSVLLGFAFIDSDPKVIVSAVECEPIATNKIKKCLNCCAILEDGQLQCPDCGSDHAIWE